MNTPATQRLAVIGWTADASAALAALEATLAFRGVAVADPSAAALVQARRETGLPCVRGVSGYLQEGDYDAVLLASPTVTGAAVIGAARGASLLLLADAFDAEAIEAAAEMAQAHEVRLTLLRPASHDPGMADLRRLVDSDPAWAPHYLDVTVEAPTDVDRLLGIAVSHAVRLAPHLHGPVLASAWGDPTRAVSATLEAAGRQVHVRARHAPEVFVRISADTDAGAFDLRIAEGDASVSHTTADERLRFRPGAPDPWTVEAYRAADLDAPDDLERAREEAAFLAAIERSLLTGEAQSLSCCTRPELRLLYGGGGHAVQRPAARLHLVVS